jgi:hypothetical protein
MSFIGKTTNQNKSQSQMTTGSTDSIGSTSDIISTGSTDSIGKSRIGTNNNTSINNGHWKKNNNYHRKNNSARKFASKNTYADLLELIGKFKECEKSIMDIEDKTIILNDLTDKIKEIFGYENFNVNHCYKKKSCYDELDNYKIEYGNYTVLTYICTFTSYELLSEALKLHGVIVNDWTMFRAIEKAIDEDDTRYLELFSVEEYQKRPCLRIPYQKKDCRLTGDYQDNLCFNEICMVLFQPEAKKVLDWFTKNNIWMHIIKSKNLYNHHFDTAENNSLFCNMCEILSDKSNELMDQICLSLSNKDDYIKFIDLIFECRYLTDKTIIKNQISEIFIMLSNLQLDIKNFILGIFRYWEKNNSVVHHYHLCRMIDFLASDKLKNYLSTKEKILVGYLDINTRLSRLPTDVFAIIFELAE